MVKLKCAGPTISTSLQLELLGIRIQSRKVGNPESNLVQLLLMISAMRQS